MVQGKDATRIGICQVFSPNRKSYTGGTCSLGKVDAEPVPTRLLHTRSSEAVIVLQLLKRWRNVRYDKRAGRRPPSVLLSKLIADSANRTTTLSEELLYQARALKMFLEAAGAGTPADRGAQPRLQRGHL